MQKIYKKIAIIDGSYMLHRSLHQKEIFSLCDSNGNKTGGIFGFLRSLKKSLDNIPLDYYPVVCWDSRVSERRLAVYPNYKHYEERQKESYLLDLALKKIEEPSLTFGEDVNDTEIEEISKKIHDILSNRKLFGQDKDPDDYLSVYVDQRRKLMEILDSFGIPSIRITNWEGDDLMYLLSKITCNSILITDDSDLRQLISENVFVLRVLKEVRLLTLKEETNPQRIALVKAITGDGSDNVPQLIKGLGNVGATEIANIIQDNNEDPDKFIPELRSKITKGRTKKFVEPFIDLLKEYDRNLELVDLRRVPVDMLVINEMISTINETSKKGNYMEVVSKLGSYEMKSVNIDEIFTRLSAIKNRGGLTV